jgi:group II intron reverse transcriptase/maturase
MRLLKSNPIFSLLNSYLVDSPQPANISYMWNFGVRLARLFDYWAQRPSSYIYLVLPITLLLCALCIPQYVTVYEANNFIYRIANMQCFENDGLSRLLVEISGNPHGEVNKLETYSCHLFQGQYLKQNIPVLFEYCNWQAPIGQLLPESSTALQDSNSLSTQTKINQINTIYIVNMIVLCASTYRETDIKHIENATKGSNRLVSKTVLWSVMIMRGRRYHSSHLLIEGTKDTSRDSVSKSTIDPTKKTASRKIKSSSKTINRNAIVTMLQSKILNSRAQHQKIYNLLNIFSDVDYLVSCYLLIKGKPGNMSPGVDQTTIDGINKKWFEDTALDLKNGKFKFSPTRQVLIPKNKPGELRPLAIGSPREKIVQKALQLILEAIWEPQFSSDSHGFRTGRSVHSALLPLYLEGRNYSWVIQGDISKCFDMIPHEIILSRISKQIGDPRFLELIRKYLNAGVMLESGITPRKALEPSHRGVPQGGILSPILANIVLHQLDLYMRNLILTFEKGVKRRQNPAYSRILHLRRKATTMEERKELLRVLRTIPIGDPLDPDFKRMKFIRYADDFVILVEGSHDETIKIRNQIKELLKVKCGLSLNMEKTTINNISDNKFSFLGAEIAKLKKDPTYLTAFKRLDLINSNMRRRVHSRLLIKAPLNKILLELLKAGFLKRNNLGSFIPKAYTPIINLTHYEIISFYNSKINGLLNFYSFASNFNRLRLIIFHLQMSCAHTLARKYKLNNFAISFKKFGKKLTCPETEIELAIPKTMKVKHKFNTRKDIANFMNLVKQTWSAKITQNTFGKICVICGSSHNLEMHHLRSVKDVRAKMRTGNSTYALWLGATLRKQIPLCQYHHSLYHAGQLSASDLKEISRYSP